MTGTRGKAEPAFPLLHNFCAVILQGQGSNSVLVHPGNTSFRNPLQEVAARMKIRTRNQLCVFDYED